MKLASPIKEADSKVLSKFVLETLQERRPMRKETLKEDMKFYYLALNPRYLNDNRQLVQHL